DPVDYGIDQADLKHRIAQKQVRVVGETDRVPGRAPAVPLEEAEGDGVAQGVDVEDREQEEEGRDEQVGDPVAPDLLPERSLPAPNRRGPRAHSCCMMRTSCSFALRISSAAAFMPASTVISPRTIFGK